MHTNSSFKIQLIKVTLTSSTNVSLKLEKLSRRIYQRWIRFCLNLLFKTSCAEVTSIIASLDEKFSSEDDEIHNVVVELTISVTVAYLTTLINRSLHEGVFLDCLKKTKVIPFLKKRSKLHGDNYRPISLVIVWSKFYEGVMHTRVYLYFENF